MSSSHSHRATIPPLANREPRPIWSVMIPTYNCASYLRETLTSVLSQDPGAAFMQIEVVDDCSTQDDPKAIVEELGNGRVAFYRQPENVGYLKNFDTCLQRSRGRLVHLLHGDDCIREGFYQKLQTAFDTHPNIGAAVCRTIYMDEHSHWQFIASLQESESRIYSDWKVQIATKHYIQPPSIAVRRSVYEALGGFDHRICCALEDWEMWTRIASHYPIWYEVEPLALYRIQSKSLTKRCMCSGDNLRDYRLVIDIIHEYLPQDDADRVTRQSLEHNALCAVAIASDFLKAQDFKTALLQLKGSLQLSTSPRVIYSIMRLVFSLPFRLRSTLFRKQ